MNPNEFGGQNSTGRLDPPTADYAERDSYRPDRGSIASQAQYSTEIENEAREGRKGPLTRFLRAIRRTFWG